MYLVLLFVSSFVEQPNHCLNHISLHLFIDVDEQSVYRSHPTPHSAFKLYCVDIKQRHFHQRQQTAKQALPLSAEKKERKWWRCWSATGRWPKIKGECASLKEYESRWHTLFLICFPSRGPDEWASFTK